MSALRNHAALAGHDGDAGNGTTGYYGSRHAKRSDTLIASAVLVVLLAGWVMNFVSFRQLSLGLSVLIAHASIRQT